MARRIKKIHLKFPEGIEPETIRFMKIVMAELSERDELPAVMEGVIIMLMNCYNTYIQASKEVRQSGMMMMNVKDEAIVNPAVGAQLKSNQQCLALMKELGLTIKARKVLDNAKEGTDMLSIFEDKDFE
jgi:P27 family predicted phage terminase small subunit